MRAPAKTFVRARRLRREMTLPEVRLWEALRANASGVRFRRQHAMGPYVLDFYALAVEVDGAAHDVASNAARDVQRDAWLAARDIRTLRFNAVDLLSASRRVEVLETIGAVIAERL